MNNQEYDSLILESLKILLEKVLEGYQLESGICHNIDMILMWKYNINRMIHSHLFLCEHWISWEHYSGNNSYPIPGRFEHSDNWIGKKRELRISLIKHLILCYERNYERNANRNAKNVK